MLNFLMTSCGISCAGLRIILAVQKIVNKQGKLIIPQVNETILEVFESTGYIHIWTYQIRKGNL